MGRIISGALVLLLVYVAPADQAKPKQKPATPAEQYQALVRECRDAMLAWQKIYQAAKTDEERKKSYERYPNFDPKFLELAAKHPKDPVALDALVWVGSHATGPTTQQGKALAILRRDHIRSEKLDIVCRNLIYSSVPDADAEQFLREVLGNNPHQGVRGQACLALGILLKSRAGANKDAASEAEKLLERAATKYGDLSGGRVGERAKGELFELRFLAVGKKAPEIEGEDADGKRFNLSDYRGRVVVLDFWGNW
jgi:hypothetical protein